MTDFLLRLFVKDHSSTEQPRVRAAMGALSGWVGICCNLMLFTAKLLIGLLAGSVSITADALNNLSDASGSIVTLIGFRLADKPADTHHPYGSGYTWVASMKISRGFTVILSSSLHSRINASSQVHPAQFCRQRIPTTALGLCEQVFDRPKIYHDPKSMLQRPVP